MKDFRPCLGGLMRSLRPARFKVLVSGAVGLVNVAASLGFIALSKRLVDIATGSAEGNLGGCVALFAGIVIVQIACSVFGKYWEGLVTVDLQNSLREEYFSSAMRSRWDGRERFHSADTVSRLEEDIRVVSEFLCVNLPECMVTIVQFIAAVVLLFSLSANLAWVLVFIMPVAVIGSRLFFRKMRALSGEIRQLDSRVQGHMQENLQHRVLVKTFCSTAKILSRLGSLQGEVRGKNVERLNYGAISRAFMGLGFMGGYAVTFLWGVFGLRDGSVTYGMMVAFLQLVGQVQRPVADFARHIPAFIRSLSSQERLMEIDEQPQEIEPEPCVLEGAPGISVEGLSFSYGDDAVIDGLSYDFKPGTMTAILGRTGAGKSTLVRLIMALLAPSRGEIYLYDGKRRVRSDVSTRCNFMYVPQGNSLMSGTIRENLLLAREDATQSEMEEALHMAAADFVLELPKGLDTLCSETGGGLSEGQAQRIAVARALLRPGGVLILDEATSALDAQTESEMLARITERFRGSKTIICITHRSAAADCADGVLDLQEARATS